MPKKQQLLDIIALQSEIAKLGLDLGATMSLIVERVLSLIDAEGAAIELLEGEEMVYRAASGIAAAQLGLRLRADSSLSGLCVRSGEILCCRDTEKDRRVDRQACRQVGLRSMLVAPLSHHGHSVGVLKVMSSAANRFHANEKRVIELLSEVIGAVMYFASKYSEDELLHKATHDGMTGLANRALFVDRMRSMLARHAANRQAAGILIIDMDGLKQINDQFGHRAGDGAITEFATRLRACARQSDTVARLGGDEFAILMAPIEAPEALERMVERIQSTTQIPFEFENRAHRLQASIGSAAYPFDGNDLDSLLETADQRMYSSKRAGYARRAPHLH